MPQPEPPPVSPPVLRSATDAGAPLTAAQLDSVVAGSNANSLAGAVRCDVQLVEIVYATAAPDGTPTQASGAVMLPSGPACPGPYRLAAYARGTDLDRARAMASGGGEAQLVAALLAGQGFVVAATDYLGYAKSTFPTHPYLHAGSEATSNVDALRAAREVAAARGVALNGQVYVTGYSQGGHAALATQRLIETSLGAEFALAGAGLMSGPYDLVGSIVSALDELPLGELGSTYYVPFAITSLQKVYGNLYSAPSQFFESPYDATIETLFPRTDGASLTDLLADRKLPLLLDRLITPAFESAARDAASPMRQALLANSPIDFTPKAPIVFCGGSKDPVVNFANTTTAAAAFQARGAPVTVVDVENEPAYAGRLRDDLVPVDIDTGYHASLVPPLCLLQVRDRFLTD
ncbi:MAG: lipase family protein [Lautropia sp.]